MCYTASISFLSFLVESTHWDLQLEKMGTVPVHKYAETCKSAWPSVFRTADAEEKSNGESHRSLKYKNLIEEILMEIT